MHRPAWISVFLDWLDRLARNRYFWGGLSLLLVVGAVVYVTVDSFLMPSYTRHGVSVTVPDVEGTPVEEARDRLADKDLRVQTQSGRFNPNVPRRQVVDQSPPPQAGVKPGRRIYLTINSGNVPSVRIPDVTGTSLREARNRIAAIGLEVGSVQADSIPSPYPQTVTRQRPEPGDSLDQGSSVDLWYSTGLGEAQVRVPAVVGLTVQRARQTLLRQKLRAVVIRPEAGPRSQEASSASSASPDTSGVARSFVREQSATPGSRLQAGKEVRLYTTTDSSTARDRRSELPDSLRRPPVGPDTSATAPDTARSSAERIGF